jgi:signal peptidase II
MPHIRGNSVKRDNRYVLLCLTALTVVIVDQISKWIIIDMLDEYGMIQIMPNFFNLVHYRNRGAAFGFLNTHSINWQIWLFTGASLLAAFIIFRLTRGASSNSVCFTGRGLILGGATGNLIDRFRFRSVVDFLDFYVGSWHWPAFNIADSGICVGAGIVCYFMWRNQTPAPQK